MNWCCAHGSCHCQGPAVGQGESVTLSLDLTSGLSLRPSGTLLTMWQSCVGSIRGRRQSDTGVGKSSIVCRFVQDHFDHNISPTIGASFMTKTVPCGNELHKFLIWDTAGQERFHSLAPMYYRGSAAAVIVYDITKQDSFHTLKKWVKELKEHGPENIVMAIAGNKCDLSDIREVPLKDAREYAESIGAVVVETSAKNAINVEELFQGISEYPICAFRPACVFSPRGVRGEESFSSVNLLDASQLCPRHPVL
ncbi:ras-related protein Rab-31 [Camelus ferus]|nr:ras-related protein Rab-31 [Camelus ferus]